MEDPIHKDHIADVAGEVIFARGFQGASLQEIAEKSRISKAGIYHYFKTKEEILLYILFKNTALGVASLQTCLEKNEKSGLTPCQSLKQIIKTYTSFLLENRKTSLIVLRERHQLTGKKRRLLLLRERTIFHFLKELLRKIPERKKELDLNLVAFQIMAAIHWMGYWFDEKGGLSRQQAISQTIDVIFNGVLTKSS